MGSAELEEPEIKSDFKEQEEVRAKEYLEQIPMWAAKKNSLADIRKFLKEMGDPDDSMRIIHVAGTNGKGSVCACLSSVLQKSGYHVAMFSSPHLIDMRERFLFDGEMVSEELFEASYKRIRRLSEKMMEAGFSHPTYFEFLFLMGMDMFRERKPDFVVLETGLGGRLDATNVIRHPQVTVITSISMDHTEYLGDTVEAIASEKAGIIKPGIPVVWDAGNDAASSVIRARAKELSSPMIPVDRRACAGVAYGKEGIQAELWKMDGSRISVAIPSQADYQVMNSLLALRAAEILSSRFPVSDSELASGISSMKWPARMEEALPGLYLDGAHNPGGVEEFIKTADRLCASGKKRAYLLFSAVSDKAHKTMIEAISRQLPLDGVVVAHIKSERGEAKERLAEEFEAVCECGVEGFPTVEEALDKLLSYRDDSHLLFCVGSLYLMGEIRAILRRNEL